MNSEFDILNNNGFNWNHYSSCKICGIRGRSGPHYKMLKIMIANKFWFLSLACKRLISNFVLIPFYLAEENEIV